VSTLPRIVEILTKIKNRPSMFLRRPDDITSLDTLLTGFEMGVVAGCGPEDMRHAQCLFAAMRAHGYTSDPAAGDIYDQIRKRGMSPEMIIQERLMLEIEAWEIYFADEAE
jgi:hypothetical protein